MMEKIVQKQNLNICIYFDDNIFGHSNLVNLATAAK